ncbi:unnamed protein product [Urochloa humidicola]
MDVRRRLLPMSVDGEEGQCEDCVFEGTASISNEHPPSEGMAAAAAPGAGDKVDMEHGLEVKDPLISKAGAVHTGIEEDLFFDLGTGDATGWEDGDAGNHSSSEDGDSSSNCSSQSEGTEFDEEDMNDGKKGSSGSYDEEMFRDIVDAADQHTSLDEFWNIANKIFVSEEDAFLFYNKYA